MYSAEIQQALNIVFYVFCLVAFLAYVKLLIAVGHGTKKWVNDYFDEIQRRLDAGRPKPMPTTQHRFSRSAYHDDYPTLTGSY